MNGPDPFSGYEMKGPKLDVVGAQEDERGIPLATLSAMTHGELVALVRLCNAKQVGYALMSREEKSEALRLKIYGIAMDSKNDIAVIKAANDWLDREFGKAKQHVEVNNTGSVSIFTPDLSATLRFIKGITGGARGEDIPRPVLDGPLLVDAVCIEA